MSRIRTAAPVEVPVAVPTMPLCEVPLARRATARLCRPEVRRSPACASLCMVAWGRDIVFCARQDPTTRQNRGDRLDRRPPVGTAARRAAAAQTPTSRDGFLPAARLRRAVPTRGRRSLACASLHLVVGRPSLHHVQLPGAPAAHGGEFRLVVVKLPSPGALGIRVTPNPAAPAPASTRGFRRAPESERG